ncbi:hypothetical protein HCN44_000369 [Aphidius gifuensis]|uniref:Deoxyribonuclease TATDN1 n=1 Tax=Aphidius gifuensis TaxID=684658 RepID=A0A834XSN9_APHGI|nr:hypothetical protein HCN44_000369 [Aphidius gifuensis]
MNTECVAIGECGLDYNRNFSDPETQLCSVFHKQVELVLIHSFIGNADEAKIYIDKGFYLAITGYLCKDKPDSGVRQVLEMGNVPLDKILVQTDAPFMYPNNRASKLLKHV